MMMSCSPPSPSSSASSPAPPYSPASTLSTSASSLASSTTNTPDHLHLFRRLSCSSTSTSHSSSSSPATATASLATSAKKSNLLKHKMMMNAARGRSRERTKSTSSLSASVAPASSVSSAASAPASVKKRASLPPTPTWYLQVGVAGKPNPMFLSDNLTPAPRPIMLQQLYGDKTQQQTPPSSTMSPSPFKPRRVSSSAETDTEQSSPSSCTPSSTGSSVFSDRRSSLAETPSSSPPSSLPSSTPSSPQPPSRITARRHSSTTPRGSTSSRTRRVLSMMGSHKHNNTNNNNSNNNNPNNNTPGRCRISLVAGRPIQFSRFDTLTRLSPQDKDKDDLMTVHEEEGATGASDDANDELEDEEEAVDVDGAASPDVTIVDASPSVNAITTSTTTISTSTTSSSASSPSSSLCQPYMSVGAADGFGQDAWLVVCEQPLLAPHATRLLNTTSNLSNLTISAPFPSSSSSSSSPPPSSSSWIPPSFLLGVADGVGGWRSSGVDSGLMSRAVLRHTMQLLQTEAKVKKDREAVLSSMHEPKSLLERSYEKVLDDEEVRAGSTTACLLSFVPAEHHSCSANSIISALRRPDSPTRPPAILNAATASASSASATAPPIEPNTPPKMYLHTCNLGDSGFCVVRGSRVIFHSSPQRDVNHVHQLAVIPDELRAQQRDADYEFADDKPDDALCACCELKENDVVILASDGVWDNIQPRDEIVTVSGVGLARLRYKNDAPERTLYQHETIARAVVESRFLPSPTNAPATTATSTTSSPKPSDIKKDDAKITTNSINNSSGVLFDDVDVERCCERLAMHAAEYMGLQEGKPDDLTLICAQVKLWRPTDDDDDDDIDEIDEDEADEVDVDEEGDEVDIDCETVDTGSTAPTPTPPRPTPTDNVNSSNNNKQVNNKNDTPLSLLPQPACQPAPQRKSTPTTFSLFSKSTTASSSHMNVEL